MVMKNTDRTNLSGTVLNKTISAVAPSNGYDTGAKWPELTQESYKFIFYQIQQAKIISQFNL